MLKKALAVIRKIFENKHFPLAIAIIAFLVTSHTIKYGLMLDDLNQRTTLIDADRVPENLYKTGMVPEKPGTLSAAIFEQFGFSRDESRMDALWDYGVLPWWIPKGIKAAIWRPLTSFTHWLDYRLFPDSPELMHVHHLLWFSAVIFLIAVLYRRLLSPTWVAAIAVIFFLIDENNVFPVVFIAHRNSIIAMFFGLLCMLSHHHWRENNSLAAAIAAVIFLLLSLLSAEAGLATFGYILAYAIALEKGSLIRRAATIAPAVCTIILWRLVYNAFGYGTHDLGLYVDPVNEPIRYTMAVLERLPMMLTGFFSATPPDFAFAINPRLKMWYLILGLVFLLILLAAMMPLLRRSRLARFFSLAIVFAVIPFCACIPFARNLLFASIAGFALISIFIADVFKRADYIPKAYAYKILIWAVAVILLIIHIPAALAGRVVGQKMTLPSVMGPPRELVDNVRSDQELVILNSPCALVLTFLPFAQAYEGLEPTGGIKVLTPALRSLEVFRADERTLIIKSKGGDIFSCDDVGPMHITYCAKTFNDLFRNEKFSFQAGQVVILPRLTIEVLSINQNTMPTKVSFTFETPLEDKSLCFYKFSWRNFSYEKFTLPAVGESVELPGPSYTSWSDVFDFFRNAFANW
ncbi:MAG: hypothetical protein ACYSR9_09520 [Planctomycetota bacterium]|jgi:hypothetical protein